MVDQILGHYRVIKKLDQGGMGAVYLAEDTRLPRKAVLKFLLQEHALDAELKARFEREARVAAVLKHPNIVTIYEIGEYGGVSFIAMEYVEGESLADLLAQTELRAEDVLELAIQICEGLREAHGAGITHRDLKPANILLDKNVRVKIADFGIAKLHGSPRLTQPGDIIGTPDYMSPEQAKGEELDQRSDIFSLGIILYEMLAGQRPFQGSTHTAKRRAIINHTPPPLAQCRPDLSPGWQRIIDKALAKNPAARYQQVDQLRADLERELKWMLPPAEPAEELLTAEYLGKYRIEQKIGQGGMGEVFKARDTKLDRLVAIKKIKSSLAKDEVFLGRFRDEAKVLAKLDSRHIVRIYDLLETRDAIFIVMEYLEGSSLDQNIQRSKAIPLANACDMLKQMLRGIGHAHHAGVLHRDLKPSNVMLSPQGNVKLMDFGMAKIQEGPKRTSAFGAGGTLLYMSPEQVQGLANVDHRGDLYSLGMTFYEMLAGRLPFEANDSDYAIRKTIVEKEFPPPHQFNPAVPPALSEIVLKAISKQPQQRFQNAGEMIQAIEKYEQRAQPSPFRRQAVSRMAVPALLAALLLGVFIYFRFYRQPVSPRATVSVVTQPAGATVYLNGKSIGATPINALPLEAGRINLALRKANYTGRDTAITVKAGQATPLVFFLQPVKKISSPPLPPAVGGVKITSTPSRAKIWLNGKIAGNTPYENRQIPAGRHRFVVQQKGYFDDARTIDVRSGETIVIATKLTAVRRELGSLYVASQPPGAALFLNGENVGSAPVMVSRDAGRYSIVLRKAGYRDYATTATVMRGRMVTVAAQLVALEGTLSILVTPPGGLLSIDGKPYKLDANVRSSFKLSAGLHRMQVRNANFGLWEKIVKIEPDKELELAVDFNKEFTVRVITGQPEWGEIYVDNRRLGDTPMELRLRTGRHVIEVRREGYAPERKILNLENDLVEPLRFNLKLSQ